MVLEPLRDDGLGELALVLAGQPRAAALLVGATGNAFWDTAIALAIAAFVAVRAVMLGREVLVVLGQHAPAGMDPEEVAETLAAVPGVTDVHDVHLWTLTSGMNVATAHLVTSGSADTHSVLDQAREVMRSRFGVDHATLQVEPDTHSGCQEVTW